jgi:putative ABC transport system permease protein
MSAPNTQDTQDTRSGPETGIPELGLEAPDAAREPRRRRAPRLRVRRPALPAPVARLTRRLRRRTPLVVPRGAALDRFGFRDLLGEAAFGIAARPGRLVLTVLGTVLGIASLVVTIGLAQTAAGQISRQFDAVAATQVVLEPGSARTQQGNRSTGRIPWDVEDRLTRLAGVEKAGALGTVNVDGATITTVPVNDPSQPVPAQPQVFAATPGLLDAIRGDVVTGRWFDTGHDTRADRVVVLGERAAIRLGVHRLDRQPSLFIGDRAYTVIGIVDGMSRRSDLLDAVIMPVGTARADFDLGALEQAQVAIAVGAGPVVGEQAPVALAPNAPETIEAQVPPPPSQVKRDVQADVNTIFLALGGVALLVGAVGIANITLLSVRERTAEIGLRRALGARTRDIGRQFLVESSVIGLLGGLVGATLGVVVVLGVSLAQEWTPILDTWMTVACALLGGVVGLVAGTYPALKAAAVEPIAALRGA